MREGRKTKWIVGVDEVGRGPLAGPVTVCALAIRTGSGIKLSGNFDSKRVSAKEREEVFYLIRKLAKNNHLAYSHCSSRARTIDKIGIGRAVKNAVAQALRKLESKIGNRVPDCEIWLDGGLRAPAKYVSQRSIVRGDSRIPIIGLASIIAKVHRDGIMTRFSKKYPEYGFSGHKGYGTSAHYVAIDKHGPTPIHRLSFL